MPPTDSPVIDWSALARLRQDFLAGTAGARDYWQQGSDLVSYDATFAQRIGWKWDFVLAELHTRGWEPPAGELLDWGCGSGIAARAFLDHFGTGSVSNARFWDRSTLAMEFAARRAVEKYPNLAIHTGAGQAPAILLLSHVLSELAPEETDRLLLLALNATTVLWVEPGTYESSRALIAVRERLRVHFPLVSPCPHQGVCGILAPGNAAHWCHFFASPPPGVFTDPFWGEFARVAGVDLRSLPVSYLVLDQRPAHASPGNLPASAGQRPPSPCAMRVLGRPRLTKPSARILGCDRHGVIERELTRREFPELYRRAKRGDFPGLNTWCYDARRVVELKPWPAMPVSSE